MITQILSGILLGMTVTLLCTQLFFFIARRRCWLEVRIAPSPNVPVDQVDHIALDKVVEDHAELREDFDELISKLAPYLDRKGGN